MFPPELLPNKAKHEMKCDGVHRPDEPDEGIISTILTYHQRDEVGCTITCDMGHNKYDFIVARGAVSSWPPSDVQSFIVASEGAQRTIRV